MNENTQPDEPADLSENEADEMAEDTEKPAPLVGEKRRQTLFDHLALFDAIDNGQIEMSDAEVEELMFQAEGKVDRCEHVHALFRRQEAWWKEEKERAERYRKRAENNRLRLEASMLRALEKNGFEQFPGSRWTIRQKKTTSVEVSGEINEMMVFRYPTLFKTTIRPMLTPIRKYIEADNTLDFARIRENKKIEFKPNLEAVASTKRGKK